jgi:hypothetical protein
MDCDESVTVCFFEMLVSTYMSTPTLTYSASGLFPMMSFK